MKHSEILVQVNDKEEFLKLKKHSYKLFDQCIDQSYAVSYLIGHRKRTSKHYSKADAEEIVPVVLIELPNSNRQQGMRLYKTLLDSGASSSVVSSRVVQHLECERAKITSFTTVAGQFYCTNSCRTQIKISELKVLAKIEVRIHMTQMKRNYDVILGQDVLSKLDIVLDFEQQLVWWGNKIVKMRSTECTQ